MAGSRATTHTLWNVVDSASAEFTTRFFKAVRAGANPEEALTRTKREFLTESRHADPAYWAPYVLVQTGQ
jgi:CHAT domain-containing protein